MKLKFVELNTQKPNAGMPNKVQAAAMKTHRFVAMFLILVAAILLAACDNAPSAGSPDSAATNTETSDTSQDNVLVAEYREYELADLDTAEGLTRACEQEVAALATDFQQLEGFSGTPTVATYLEPLNAASVSASNMYYAASTLAAVHPDEGVRAAGEACQQSMSGLLADFGLSRPIFDRVSQVDASAADDAAQRFLEKQLQTFQLSGVDKDDATRARIKALNEEITTVGQTFDRNIRESVLTLELDSVDQLAGLPQDYIDNHPPGEDGKIRITTQYPDYFPFMSYAEDDELRRQLSLLRQQLAHPENGPVLKNLLELRHELAQLIGFDTYADLVTADKMAGSPERVQGFLQELSGYTTETQQREYNLLLERLQQNDPGATEVKPWQATYLMEKVTTERFDVDSKKVREYFSYENTREGILSLVQDLFNVQIKPWQTYTWHEDVGAYELWDGDELIGRFFLDMHPRDGKYQHAAAFPLKTGITGVQTPLGGLVCNFPRGEELMPHSQVETFLHEFGHLIHMMFSGSYHWSGVSGISTEWDFVEAPSQMLQEWVWDYETVSRFARNADGDVLPREMLEKMQAARDFGLGMTTRRQLSLAAMSMGLYDRDPEGLDIKQFTDDITREYTLFEPLDEGHFYAAFGHLNGYSAIYYTYQWSLAIASDLFTRFEAEGLRNVETAGDYRDAILSQGGVKPAADLVTDFLGRDISFKPYADRLSGTAEIAEGSD